MVGKRITTLLLALGFIFLPGVSLASTYGSGTYGTSLYSADNATPVPTPSPTPSPVIKVGPLSLPDTGATWLTLGGAAFLAAGGSYAYSRHQRRKRLSAA